MDDTVPPSGDGRYELFKELDEQIRDGVKELIHRGTTLAYHAHFEKDGAYLHMLVGCCVGLNNLCNILQEKTLPHKLHDWN